MTKAPIDSLPLNVLMSAPLVEITHAFAANVGPERQSPRHGPAAILATYSNIFRHLGKELLSERELRERARLSKRATHFLVDQAKRSGWVAVESGGGAGKRIELTDAGRTVANECAQHSSDAEKSFRARVGDERSAELRPALETLVSKLDLELPHYPVGYGPADASITGGGARFGRGATSFDWKAEQRAVDEWEAESESRLDVRYIGDDWSPVARVEGDTVSNLSLTPLLSQALVAFTIDYEGIGGLSLAYVADLVRHIGDEGIQIKLRPNRGAGAIGEIPVHWAFAGLKRHGFASVATDESNRRMGLLLLTKKGRQVRDAYEEVAAAIEHRWLKRYGESTVQSLRVSLESVLNAAEHALPHHLLSLTTGLTEVPTDSGLTEKRNPSLGTRRQGTPSCASSSEPGIRSPDRIPHRK